MLGKHATVFPNRIEFFLGFFVFLADGAQYPRLTPK